MGRREHHVRGGAIVVGPQPVCCRHAPAVPGYQARELELGHRGAEIVSDPALVLKELSGHHSADRVAALVFRTGATAPVPEEPGDRVAAARLQLTTEDIAVVHATSIAHRHRALTP